MQGARVNNIPLRFGLFGGKIKNPKTLQDAINEVVLKNKGETIVVVTHGGTIRIIMPYLLNRPKEKSFKHDPSNASITVFEHIDGKFKQLLVDDTSHL